jgi:NAD(P)-dependent dehydrogenase (short-subunit alcohol dehydrogenase family)
MTPIRFEQRVAIITGAGGGLGRAHALELARRGAKVVVNDPAGAVDGVGGDQTAADKVVAEIHAAGFEAVPNHDDVASVEGARRLVQTTIEAYGRVDVLINNAGILRDKSLAKMEPADFDGVVAVHLLGSAYCSQAVLGHMQGQGYGRIVMTTSAAGLYGDFGQTHYGAAKLRIVGLMNSLKLEAGKYGILVNTVALVALTRMTESLPLAAMLKEATTERVTAAVAFMASQACDFSGEIVAAGAGYFARVQMMEGQGVHLADDELSAEGVAAHWAQIADMSRARPFANAGAALTGAFATR